MPRITVNCACAPEPTGAPARMAVIRARVARCLSSSPCSPVMVVRGMFPGCRPAGATRASDDGRTATTRTPGTALIAWSRYRAGSATSERRNGSSGPMYAPCSAATIRNRPRSSQAVPMPQPVLAFRGG